MAEPLQKKALFNTLHIVFFFFVIFIAKSSHAQTLLLPGDIVFVSVDAHSNTFEFIPLVNLEKGTEFQIGNGIWSNKTQAFTDNEAVMFTAKEDIVAGTPINFDRDGSVELDTNGSVELSNDSKRLFLYQLDNNTTRFIYAVGWGSNDGRKRDSFFGSDIPFVFQENPHSILRLGTLNNYQYYIKNGASGTLKMLQEFVANVSYWRGNNEQGFPKFGTSFNLLNPPVILFDQSLTAVKENDRSITLNVAIYEHDGSKLTVEVAFDSTYSSLERDEINGFSTQEINFTGLIGDAVYEVKVPLSDDRNYEGTETGIFMLQNLSKGRFGDFLSHTLLVLDNETPEVRLELSDMLGEPILVIHNLESREINIGNWELKKGNTEINLSRNTLLGVGKSIVFVEEGRYVPASILSSVYRLDVDQAEILASQGTIQLRNVEGTKISEIERSKYALNKVGVLSQAVKAPNTDRVSQNAKAEIMTTSSDVVLPGWRTASSNELILNEFESTELYFWDESSTTFLRVGEDGTTLPKEAILIGYFDESAASKFEEKRKKGASKNNSEILSAVVSTTDSNEDGRIQNMEGLNLVRNNSSIAVTAGRLKKLIENKLDVDIHLYQSSPNFANISLLEDEDLVFPQKVFWIKFNSEIETEKIEIDLQEIIAPNFSEVDVYKGILELKVTGQSNQEGSIQIDFLTDMETANNTLNLKLNDKIYLNSFNGTIFTGTISDQRYDLIEINSSLSNITELPLNFASSKSGEFELEVKKWIDIPDGWVIQLEDLKEDKSYELSENWSLKFNYTNLNDIETDKVTTPFNEERFVLKLVPEELLGNEDINELPSTVELYQNYPNPFNPTTTLSFYMPEDGNVKLSIFNIVGQPVAVLLQKSMSEGEHNLEWDASDMPSGIYIYQLEIGAKIMTRKMTLVK